MESRRPVGGRTPKAGTRLYAEQAIARSDYVVCVCGQMFAGPDDYIAHYQDCVIVERGDTAAQDAAAFVRD